MTTSPVAPALLRASRRLCATRRLRVPPALALTLVLLATSTGCGSPAKLPAAAPPIELQLRHFSGTPLTGPLTQALPRPASHESTVHFLAHIYSTARAPDFELPPASATSLLILSEGVPPSAASGGASGESRSGAARAGEALRYATQLTSSVRVGTGKLAEDVLERMRLDLLGGWSAHGRLDGAVLPGSTAVLALQDPDDPAQRVEIELTVSMEGSSEGAVTVQRGPRWRETVFLAHDPLAQRPLLLALPSPRPGGRTLLVEIRSFAGGRAPAAPLAENLAQQRETAYRGAVESAQLAAERADGLSPVESSLRQILSAIDALEAVQRHRPALIFLAGATAAPLAEEIALSAPQELVQAFVARVLAAAGGEVRDALALGWLLESCAYAELAARAAAAPLAPELDALLLRQAGQLGRFPGTLAELVAGSGSQAALRAQLLRENLVFLEDTQPAARVRAFDWLSRQGRAPAGYDPLGSREERRAALTAAPGDRR
ncbi:MAG: hypothetical protein ACT4PU_07950 [Planctomycetota bacterium]